MECKDLRIRLSGKEIIKGISFACPRGKLTVIAGKNGSGKTTVLRALAGLIPFEGKITAGGADIGSFSKKEYAAKVSFMPQILPAPHITVTELVRFGRSPFTGFSGILTDKDKETADEAMFLAGIEHLRDKYADELSGGERRLAFFAMMLCQDADIMLLDEPTANLDAVFSKALLNRMTECRDRGKTVITVLHDMNQVFDIADNIIVLEKGELIFRGSAQDAAMDKIPEICFMLKAYRCTAEDGAEHIIYK